MFFFFYIIIIIHLHFNSVVMGFLSLFFCFNYFKENNRQTTTHENEFYLVAVDGSNV